MAFYACEDLCKEMGFPAKDAFLGIDNCGTSYPNIWFYCVVADAEQNVQ